MSSEPTTPNRPPRSQARAVRLAVAPGLELEGDAFGDPSDAPVIFLHGGGQTRHAWSGSAEAIARDGWYTLSIDLRGHGASDWDAEGDYRFDAFAQDVAQLAKHFERPPIWVGASLGGISALLALGENDPPPGSALVLVDIATRMESSGVERIIAFMRSKPHGFASLDEAADAIAEYMPHRPRPADPSGLAKNLRLHADGRYRWHWDPRFVEGPSRPAANHYADRLDRAAAKLRLPVLLVRGRMSDVLSEEGVRHFLQLAPHARYADVSGAGHMVAGDRNDAFTRSVREFLSELRGATESAASAQRGGLSE